MCSISLIVSGEIIQMYCATVHESDKISEKDKADALSKNVTLIGAKLPVGTKKVDFMDLDIHPASYYQSLCDLDVTHIIGHVPNLANGAINIRDMFCIPDDLADLDDSNDKEQVPENIDDIEHPEESDHSDDVEEDLPPKIVLFVHDLPRDDHGDTDHETLTRWLKEADTVISLGRGIYNEVEGELANVDEPPDHFEYIPDCPLDFLTIKGKVPTDNVPKATKQILLFTGERKDSIGQKIDFNLAVRSSLVAADQLEQQSNPEQSLRTQLVITTVHPSDKEAWEHQIKQLKEMDQERCLLQTKVQCIQDEKSLRSVLQRASLAIVPLKHSANVLGLEALMAAYASVPVLTSQNAGLAIILDGYHHLKSIVCDTTGNMQKDITIWSGNICRKIKNPMESHKEANEIRTKILMDTTTALSHIKFIETITGKTS